MGAHNGQIPSQEEFIKLIEINAYKEKIGVRERNGFFAQLDLRCR